MSVSVNDVLLHFNQEAKHRGSLAARALPVPFDNPRALIYECTVQILKAKRKQDGPSVSGKFLLDTGFTGMPRSIQM